MWFIEVQTSVSDISFKIMKFVKAALFITYLYTPYRSSLIIICHLGRLSPVWEFFTERIRLKNEVDLIRGNLKLQDERRKRKCSNNEEDDDDYEINVVTRSLHKTKKQMQCQS